MTADGDLGVEAAGDLPAVVAHQERVGALVIGVVPGVAHFAAGTPEAIEVAGSRAVAVQQGTAVLLDDRREEAQVAQDQTSRLAQGGSACIAAPGTRSQSDHGAQARVGREDIDLLFCGHRSLDRCGFANSRGPGQHGQVVAAVLGAAEHIGRAANAQDLAAEAAGLRAIDQHASTVQAEALLAQGDQAVLAQKADGSLVKEEFSPAGAGADLLSAIGRLVDLGLLFVDVDLASVDDPADRGAVKGCGEGTAHEQWSHSQTLNQASAETHHCTLWWTHSTSISCLGHRVGDACQRVHVLGGLASDLEAAQVLEGPLVTH